MAYLVFHDAYAKGDMDVYLRTSYEEAVEEATFNNLEMDSMGYEDVGFWRAYEILPEGVGVFAYHVR